MDEKSCVCFQKNDIERFKAICAEIVCSNSDERIKKLIRSSCYFCRRAALIACVKLANDQNQFCLKILKEQKEEDVLSAIFEGKSLFFEKFCDNLLRELENGKVNI